MQLIHGLKGPQQVTLAKNNGDGATHAHLAWQNLLTTHICDMARMDLEDRCRLMAIRM